MKKNHKKQRALYYVPVPRNVFRNWEYYQVDLDMLNETFNEVTVCHSHWTFFKEIIFRRPSLVYLWWWHQSLICIVIARVLRITVYATGAVHMYDESGSPDFFTKGFLYRLACKLSWKLADKNIFISKSQFRQVTSHQTVNNPTVLMSSLRKSYQLTEQKNESDIGGNNKIICMLTVVWMTKNQLKRKSIFKILDSLKLLVDSGITNFEWTIAGRNADGRKDVEAKINSLNLGGFVTLLCDISEMQKLELYTKADLYIQPSYYEGFGNAVLEAMSYGTPAIVSRNTSQPEVIGTSGFVLEEIEPEHIFQTIADFLSLSSDQRITCRREVRKIIKERHLFQYRLNKFVTILSDNIK